MKLSEQKRLDILTAAEQLFYQQGAQHTSMDEVAKQAQVSKRTVYNHFATKDELFHAILAQVQEKLEKVDVLAFDPDSDIRQQLLSIATQETALLTSEELLRTARIAFMQMLQQPELAARLENSKVGCMRYLETFLEQAGHAGSLKIDNVPFAARQFVYQLKSFIFYPRLYGFEVPDKQQEAFIIEQTVDMFVARYAPPAR